MLRGWIQEHQISHNIHIKHMQLNRSIVVSWLNCLYVGVVANAITIAIVRSNIRNQPQSITIALKLHIQL